VFEVRSHKWVSSIKVISSLTTTNLLPTTYLKFITKKRGAQWIM